MKYDEQLARALRSTDAPRALRAVVAELAQEGHTRTQIGELLEDFLLQVRADPGHREVDEDTILDLMDALTGFCHPSAQLLPEDSSVDPP